MRVCIITPFFNEYPNAMASAEKMAKALSEQHTVTVYTSRTYNAAAIEQLDNVHIERLPAWYIPEPANYVFTRGLIRRLWKHRNDFDIFIINKYMWPVAWSTIFLKLLGKPVILATDAFQGYDWWSWSKPVNTIMWLYARTIGLVVLKLADTVVLFHQGLVTRAKALTLPFQVIHNGIHAENFHNAQPAKDIRDNKNQIIITYIGRLDKIKGYLDFLTVAKKLASSNVQYKFVVVGNTHNREEVMKQYSNKQIVFTGVRKDIPAVLAVSDMLILPTYGDGLPNVIMEAMAAGLPCIGTNINGLPYLIEDSVTGFTISPGDTKALEEKIQRLANNKELREHMGVAGYKKIMREFNWEYIVKEYSELFGNLTN